MTAIVSAIVIASSWSCVTWTNVIANSCWIAFSSSCICLRSLRSSAPSGSSRRSTRGLLTSAREGDALLLATGELTRLALLHPFEADDAQDFADAAAQRLSVDRAPAKP